MFTRAPAKIIVLIDYDNIAGVAAEKGAIINFEKLHQLLVEIGEIIFAFVFIPETRVSNLPEELNDLGFDIVVCQRAQVNAEKLEDRVDINLIQFGMKFLEVSKITHIVLVGHDRHMVHLIREAKNRKKKIIVIATDLISRFITKVVDLNDIKPLPLKEE